tara:strand:- start:266 stop:1312 length:1047 start_codon:yes stop_codon:yes gene_type:complete
MKVSFVGSASFKMASYRYRVLMPAKALMANNIDCNVVTSHDGLNADIFVFSKHFDPDKDQAAVKQIKAPGFLAANQISMTVEDKPASKVVYDVCDDHFNNPKLGSHYHWMCRNADLVIASTDKMKEIIKKNTGIDSIVINDPYEYPEVKPRHNWEQNDPTRVLWYGHPSNFKHLYRVWDDIIGYQLMVITSDIELADKASGKAFPIIPWNHENMMDGFKQAHIVVLPTGENGHNSHKGANRILEAIRQGVFVVAEPHPEYNKFKEWMYIGDIRKGLEWTRSNKGSIKERIEKAQKFVSDNYHPQTIGMMWKNALNSIWEVEPRIGQDGSTSTNMKGEDRIIPILPGAL